MNEQERHELVHWIVSMTPTSACFVLGMMLGEFANRPESEFWKVLAHLRDTFKTPKAAA